MCYRGRTCAFATRYLWDQVQNVRQETTNDRQSSFLSVFLVTCFLSMGLAPPFVLSVGGGIDGGRPEGARV